MEEEKIDKIFTTIKSCFSFHINHLQLGEKNRTIAVGGKFIVTVKTLSRCPFIISALRLTLRDSHDNGRGESVIKL